MDTFSRRYILTFAALVAGNVIIYKSLGHPQPGKQSEGSQKGGDIQSSSPIQNSPDLHGISKRETTQCPEPPCQQTKPPGEIGLPFLLSASAIVIVVIAGSGCLIWDFCFRDKKMKMSPVGTDWKDRVEKFPHKVNFTPDDLDIDLANNNDLYPTDKEDGTVSLAEDAERSLLEPFTVDPVAACSPYHLAWTTPRTRGSLASIHTPSVRLLDPSPRSPRQEQSSCTCVLKNECDGSNDGSNDAKPECDQSVREDFETSTTTSATSSATHDVTSERAADTASIASSTPLNTPKLAGYKHGRPCPTPIERLTSMRAVTAAKCFSSKSTQPFTPKTLFSENKKRMMKTPVMRLMDLHPRATDVTESPGRFEDSLMWDSYIFRPSEESLVWDDFGEEQHSAASKCDENGNISGFTPLEEGSIQLPRSVNI